MIQIEDLERRVLNMEQRQSKMITFLQLASKNPQFVNKLVKMAESSSIFTDAFHKKRRLPGVDYSIETAEATSFCDDHSSSSKQEMGNLLNQHFSDKLRLGLCPTIAENNIITLSAQSSHEDNGSPNGKHPECDRVGMECLPLVPQMMELSDTGTSICPSKNSCFADALNDESLLSCHLSLTLASCSMNVDQCQVSNASGSPMDHERDNPTDAATATIEKDDTIDRRLDDNQKISADAGTADITTDPGNARVATEAPAAPPAVVNDKFWEQFLTERPGCSETEASSGLRSDPSRELMDDSRQAHDHVRNAGEDVEQLKL
ncbi:hypothetical protein GUJ93_ZPchr0006g41430 [Zizania palustris]|uniref:Heat stress transcription factor A-5 n=1 Tax=Zizania palustris TaxID=103762 RepID=A0A8J5VT19_ZIZPA|nr:hypothetical protein GUJ93_ZPchr0006g41430 [Zizania palustris]